MSKMEFIDRTELTDLLEDGAPVTNKKIDQVSFENIDLVSAGFENCHFVSCRLIDHDMEDVEFTNCIFHDCSFSRSRLKNARFNDCVFFDATNNKNCDFSYANLHNARFEQCNLTMANFKAADCYDLAINDSKANGCCFTSATFSRLLGKTNVNNSASLTRTIFDDAAFDDLELQDCNLASSSFRNVDFSGTNLDQADMTFTDIVNADIHKASFEKTDLRNANLEGFLLGKLTGFYGLIISPDQQQDLLEGLGIRVQ